MMAKQKLKIGYPYYLSDGTVVYLNALTTDGKAVVRESYKKETSFYEVINGEQAETDIIIDVDGRILIVEKDQLFAEPPVAQRCKELEELEGLIKSLRASREKIERENNEAIAIQEEKIAALKDRISELETLAADAQQKLDALEDEYSAKFYTLRKAGQSDDYKIDEKGNVVISATDYLNLLRNDYTMNALESGGVDDWDWYYESFESYYEENGCTIDETIVSIAKQIAAKGGVLPDDFLKAGA